GWAPVLLVLDVNYVLATKHVEAFAGIVMNVHRRTEPRWLVRLQHCESRRSLGTRGLDRHPEGAQFKNRPSAGHEDVGISRHSPLRSSARQDLRAAPRVRILRCRSPSSESPGVSCEFRVSLPRT